MEKGINLQAKIAVGADALSGARLSEALPGTFARANPGLTLAVKGISPPDRAGHVTLKVYIQGEQDPASDFAALAHAALNKAVTALNSGASAAQASSDTASSSPLPPRLTIHSVQEVEGDDENSGVVLPPKQPSQPTQSAQPSPTTHPTAPPVEPSTAPGSQQRAQQPPAASSAKSKAPWWAVWKRKG